MGKVSDNINPKLILTPVDPATLTVPTGDQALVVDSTDGDTLKLLDDAGTATPVGADVTLSDSDVSPVAPNDQTGTTYTFVLADGSRLVTGNNASAQTFTIPPNSSVAYPLGTTLQVFNKGAGLITLAAGVGVTIRTPHGAKLAEQYALAQAIQVATDVWAIAGDVSS